MSESRNYVLQNLWYGHSLSRLAWSRSAELVPSDSPRLDFEGNLWFTRDPYRTVLWVSGKPIAMKDATPILWDSVVLERDGTP